MKFVFVQTPFYPRNFPSLGLAILRAGLAADGVETENVDLHSDSLQHINLLREFSYQFYKLENVHAILDIEKVINYSFEGDSRISIQVKEIIDSWVEIVVSRNPDVVGISVYDISLLYSLLFIRRFKNLIGSSIKLIVGGPSTSKRSLVTRLVESSLADSVICGEGEIAIQDIAACIRENQPPRKLYDRQEVIDLNTLPIPCFDDVDIRKKKYQHIMPVEMSRGCIYNCRFCAGPLVYGRYRRKKNELVIAEILDAVKKYNCDTFWFSDALINAKINFLEEFCDEVISLGLKIYWGGYAALSSGLTDSLCKKMYAAGCRFLRFGGESGSQSVLKHMRKTSADINLENILQLIYYANIHSRFSFIVGYPAETSKDFVETFEFLIHNICLINSIVIHEYILEEGLEKNFSSAELIPLDRKRMILRSSILELFLKTRPTEELFFNEEVIRDFKNESNQAEILFNRGVVWKSVYYHTSGVENLHSGNHVEACNGLGDFDDGDVFVSLGVCDHDMSELLENLNLLSDGIDSKRLVFFKPLPNCFKENSGLSGARAPKNCSDCSEFLLPFEEGMKACALAFGIDGVDSYPPVGECRTCEYWRKMLCYPCYYSRGRNFLQV